MRKVGGEHPFCVLIYMHSYIFHICFILFFLLSYLIFDFVYLTLSLADTHGIAKYARTYIRDTHTQADTQKKAKRKSRKIRGKTGVTADRDKIEFRLFNSSSIFKVTLREELFSLPKKNQPCCLVLVSGE